MKLQQIQNLTAATGSGSGAYKMADLTKKMSPDNPTQILTAHDLTSLRTLQRVINTSNNNNPAVEDSIIYNSHIHNTINRNNNYNHSNNNNNITNGAANHHNNSNGHANAGGGSNLVFSTIPLDSHGLLIQPSHLLPANAAASLTSNGLQQATQTRGLVTTATNGLRNNNNINTSNIVRNSISPAISNAANFISSSNNNNSNSSNNNLNSFLAKATILSAANLSGAKTSSKIFNTSGTTFSSGTNMPTTSKYVLLQPNGNGQFTTYEGATPAAAAAAAANGNAATAPSVGNIVLLATEPMDLNGSAALGSDATAVGRVIATGTAGTGDNDEELRPLAWLNDSNLIKGIVTTTAGSAGSANLKRAGGAMSSGNICIVSASNAHELIEELPHHVGSEEVTTTTPSGNVSTSGSNNNNNNITSPTELKAGTQITALSVSDFQQLKRFGNIITSGTPITLLPPHETTTTTGGRKDESAHIFGNIGAISATTTVHMGPSGTTTVVEYKSNGNIPTLQSRQLLSAASVGNANSGTTITPANLSSNGNNHHNNNNSNTINSSNYVPSSPSSITSAQSTVVSTPASITTSNSIPLPVSYSTAPSTPAGANSGATMLSLPKQLTTLPGGVVTVTSGNGTTNTIYQGQQQSQQTQHRQQTMVNNNNSNTNSNSASSTTHHPHKKYLREKMNVLDHGGGGGGGVGGGGGGGVGNVNVNNSNMGGNNTASTNGGGGNASTTAITVVASPASSSSSFSSSVSASSSSSSTAAVNGGNSPISKSFYASAANNNHNNSSVSGNSSSSGAINYSSTANTTQPMLMSNNATAATSNGTSGSPITAGMPPTYTIMQYQSVASSPGISSPEPNNSKEFYPLMAPQQQQQQQQQQLRNTMRSPTSYSSYDNDSLKDFEISSNGLGRHNTSTPQHQSHQSAQAQQQLSSSGSSASSKHSNSGSTGGSGGGGGGGSNGSGAVTPQKQKHPNNVPYDPFVHTHNKPPYSFSSLIFMAIEGSNEKALPVKEIYAWIMQHFPYFKTAPAGWKNSVRHNLSLNKSFVKVEKAPNMGKGSLWRVEPQQRQNLIQALNRSPFFPNSAVDKASSLKSPGSSTVGIGNDSLVGYDTVDSVGSGGGGACSPALKSNINPRIDPRLFPKLSKVIGGQGLLNDVVGSGAADVPDEETPSDYSTTNHNGNLNNQTSGNNKYNSYTSSPVQQNGVGGGSGVIGSGASILGPFTNFESIERLARECGADSIDDVNAATAMLALKHGAKVFSETFQNGAPVITSSPSEDHTYSAGGGAGGNSGVSTPLTNGNTAPTAVNGNAQFGTSNGQQCNGDNQSNYTSSDAAYESSEDNNNITPEELEDQRRQREGVDALLSLSRSSVVESPTKRPSSTTVEEEHISACLESNKTNNNNGHFLNGNGKMSLLTSAVAYSQQQQQQHHMYEDSSNSFHLPSFYGAAHSGPHQMLHHHSLGGDSAQRKIKPLRSLRTKIKRKAPWMSKAR